MPAIRAAHVIHPKTGERGLWIEPNWLPLGTVVGLAESQYPAVASSGSREQKRAQFEADLTAALQSQLEIKRPVTSVDSRLTLAPEPYCRVSGTDYVAQAVIVRLKVQSVNPVVFDPEEGFVLENGASRAG